MPDEMVIRYCAPTLASMKTGSIFQCSYGTHEELNESLRSLNRRLGGKGLRVLPLRKQDGRCLVYVYRPNQLRRDLQDVRIRRILSEFGYPSADPGGCLRLLMRRLQESETFPHEIGLFLGYPPEDVEGFIQHKPDVLCVGAWKVYGNLEAAQRTFARYRKCTRVYLDQHRQGKALERLTVSV